MCESNLTEASKRRSLFTEVGDDLDLRAPPGHWNSWIADVKCNIWRSKYTKSRQCLNLKNTSVRVFNENVYRMHQRTRCMNVSVRSGRRWRRRRQSHGPSSLHFFFPSLPASWKSAAGSSESERAQPRLPREDTNTHKALSAKINPPNCRLYWKTFRIWDHLDPKRRRSHSQQLGTSLTTSFFFQFCRTFERMMAIKKVQLQLLYFSQHSFQNCFLKNLDSRGKKLKKKLCFQLKELASQILYIHDHKITRYQ